MWRGACARRSRRPGCRTAVAEQICEDGAATGGCRHGLTSRRRPWGAGCGIRHPSVGVYGEPRYFFPVASLGAPFLPAALPPLGFFAPPLLPGPLSGIVSPFV